MKTKTKLTLTHAMGVLLLMSTMSVSAEQTGWGRVGQFYVNDVYPDIMRVYHVLSGQPNPAACTRGDELWIDIELNKAGRSDFQLQQMVNAIYMSMATYRRARFDIDTTRCSPDGFRLANGVGLENP